MGCLGLLMTSDLCMMLGREAVKDGKLNVLKNTSLYSASRFAMNGPKAGCYQLQSWQYGLALKHWSTWQLRPSTRSNALQYEHLPCHASIAYIWSAAAFARCTCGRQRMLLQQACCLKPGRAILVLQPQLGAFTGHGR